jgi:hypothetical protein
MKAFVLACACACALIALAGTAGAYNGSRGSADLDGAVPITFGVADDTGKYADDGSAWFDSELEGANMSEERWTL